MPIEPFTVPIVLFLFKRKEKSLQIIERISKISPRKLYLLGDEGRTNSEKQLVAECRASIEKSIAWDCEVIKNYASTNRGVYKNIGLGAKWVFEKEDQAIFLEDDNLPEISFFQYCQELLERFKFDSRILWICGTNYLGRYNSKSNDSYMFTRHLLPCGWASWAHKFNTFYDGDLALAQDDVVVDGVKYAYKNRGLFQQQFDSLTKELRRKQRGERFGSWDYQMAFSLRANNMFGISPCVNQILNIGVDTFSEHGGTSYNNIMTKRFCGMKSYPMEFPLKHPKAVLEDPLFEKELTKIILLPIHVRILRIIRKFVIFVLKLDPNISFVTIMRKRK